MNDQPNIFQLRLAANDPIRRRRPSPLPLAPVIEAARMVEYFPTRPEIQRFRKQVATFSITPDELAELNTLVRAIIANN